MNEEKSVHNYKWELLGVDEETREKISFPCSANSVGSIINQIVNEDAEGLWEIPEWVRDNLKKTVSDGTISIELISKIAKVELEETRFFLNDSLHELKLPSDSVFMLTELAKNLSSDY